MITYDDIRGKWLTPEERRQEMPKVPLMNPRCYEYRASLRIMRVHFLDPQFDRPGWMEMAKPAVEQDARVCLLRRDLYAKIIDNFSRIMEMEMRIMHSIDPTSSLGRSAMVMDQRDSRHIFAPITEILDIAMATKGKQ